MDNNINDSYINNLYDISFKIVLLGDSGVGKSSIMSQNTTYPPFKTSNY